MYWAIFFLGLFMGLTMPAGAEYARPEEHGGLRDIVLIYRARPPRTAKEYLPLVAHVDAAGQPGAWFFDGFLLLTQDPQWNYPKTREDLEGWLNAIFGEGGLLPELQKAVESTAQRLGPPPAPRQVMISIPRPECAPEGRLPLIEWLIGEVIRRWQEANPKNLQLWGMYWYWEDIAEADRPLARAACEATHRRGLKMLWIPYYRAAGWEQWREIGFDLAIMQPNYAFLPLEGNRHLPDETRLTENARLAREAGLGVEIETGYLMASSPTDQANLRLYLNHALEDGYAEAVRAHFHSFDQYQRMAASPAPEARQLYDDLFALYSGRLAARPMPLLAGAPVRRVRAGGGSGEPVSLDGPPGVALGAGDALEVSLDPPRSLCEARVGLAGGDHGTGVRALSFYGRSPGSSGWQLIQSMAEATPPAGGTLLGRWAPRMFSGLRALPEPFPGRRIAVTRLASYPGAPSSASPDNLALGRSYATRPALKGSYGDAGGELTDGLLTEAGFADGRTVGWIGVPRVVVEIPLRAPVPVEAVRCHLQGGGYGAVNFPTALSVAVSNDGERWRLLGETPPRAEPAPAKGAATKGLLLQWLCQEGPPGGDTARFVRVTLAPAGWLMLSEIEVLSRGRNVALGQPYRFRPMATGEGQYRDDGVKLTDGTAAPLWEGCVGWNGGEGDVEVDLGRLCRARAVRAYLVGGGLGAVYLPQAVEVSLSADGRTWSAPVAAKLPPTEEKSTALGVWALTEVAPQPARYARLHLKPARGWMMLGEVEVLGTEQ